MSEDLHNFSGYPGSWCLSCGQEDANEACVAEHNVLLFCVLGHELCLDLSHGRNVCQVHVNGPCPEPGSNRHNPYSAAKSSV